jgi:hypothetical protein
VLWVSTRGYHTDRSGSDSSRSGKPVRQGINTAFFTYTVGGCGFAAGGFTEIAPEATFGWEVIAVPKVVRDSNVVFTVTWTRERNHKAEASGATEVLMQPGDRVTLDVASTPEMKRVRGCGMTSAEVALELDPVDWANHTPARASVVSTDMWLVRRLPDGKEVTQQINVRGAVNEQVPFYFDDIKSGDLFMSVLGQVCAREKNGLLTLELEAERQVRNATESLGRGFTSVGPGSGALVVDFARDVVSVEFPLSSDPKWKDLGSQPLSIRIRMHRIR